MSPSRHLLAGGTFTGLSNTTRGSKAHNQHTQTDARQEKKKKKRETTPTQLFSRRRQSREDESNSSETSTSHIPPKRHLFHRRGRVLVPGGQCRVQHHLGVPQHRLAAGADGDGLHQVLQVLVEILTAKVTRHKTGTAARGRDSLVLATQHIQARAFYHTRPPCLARSALSTAGDSDVQQRKGNCGRVGEALAVDGLVLQEARDGENLHRSILPWAC